jgi:hypothetical protein
MFECGMTNIYRVRTDLLGLPGLPGISTGYFLASGGTAQQAVSAWGNFWGAMFGLPLGNGLQANSQAQVDTLDDTNGQLVTSTVTVPTTQSSAAAGETLPWATQGLVRMRTGVVSSGREIRGRLFIPGQLESNSFGSPLAAWITAVNTAGAALVSDANSVWCVWRRPKWNTPPPHTTPPDRNGQAAPVATATAWTQWAVLRSRRP